MRIAPTSEPASGSEEQNAATFGSASVPNMAGIHWPTCSSVPFARTEAAASVVPTIARPMPASPQKSSSMVIGMPRPDSSNHCVAKKSRE